MAEEIAEKSVTGFRVPAGTYWVIAGARGFAVSTRGPISISNTSANLTIVLSPLKPLSGSVRDGEGNPIAGARVAGVNGATPPPLGSLSELAVQYLAPDLSATTDQAGRWTRNVPDGAVPLLFEAAGRAAEWRMRPENDTTTLDVVLSKGATLRVMADRADPNMVVTLSRQDADASKSILADEQPRVWARWMKRSAATWNSLPAGVYGIYAKYPEPRFFMQTAAKLATVTLAPGDQRSVSVTLPVKRPATSWAVLFLRDVPREDLGEEIETFGRDGSGRAKRAEHFVEDTVGGSVVYIKTDSVRAPYYGTTKDRFFFTASDTAEGKQDESAEPLTAAALARADARLHLRFLEKDLEAPGAGTATLRGCGDGARVGVPVAISKDNIARFTAPAGCRSLVLAFAPFEAIVTAKVLRPGDQSLGEFVLHGAGSADVHVTRDPGGALVTGAMVRAVSDEVPGERWIEVTEGVTDDRGWAHLSGLPARWRLRVMAETRYGAMSDAAALRVEPLERDVIDPLLVTEPATVIVDVKIEKAFLERFPSARVVSLLMRPDDPSRDSEGRQESMPKASDTPVRFDRLHAGTWRITGVVSVAGTYSPVEIDHLRLKAGETRHLEKTITPNVFEGIVTSEGKGLPARITIEDRGQKIHFDSDAGGIFRAVLPQKGTYRVVVARLRAQGNNIPIGEVAFDDPSRRIEIAIPKGGSVTTRVRNGGRPVPRAVVWVSRREGSGLVEEMTNRGGTTDPNSDVTFDDLVPGAWTFSVRETESRRGAERTVTVDEGADIAIVLDLVDAATIAGTIRDLGGAPLPRARVDCLFVGPTGNPDRASTDSDADGAFSIDLIPPAPPVALCSIIGAMGAVDAFKSIPGQSVDLVAPAATAALTITDWSAHENRDLYWLVAPDGRAISLNAVAMKIGGFGTALNIPALAAGRWTIVRVDSLSQSLAIAAGMANSLPAVVDFTLRAGMAETVYLDSSPARPTNGLEKEATH